MKSMILGATLIAGVASEAFAHRLEIAFGGGLDVVRGEEINDIVASDESLLQAVGIPITFDKLDVGRAYFVEVGVPSTGRHGLAFRFSRSSAGIDNSYRDSTGSFRRKYDVSDARGQIVWSIWPWIASRRFSVQLAAGIGVQRVEEVLSVIDDVRDRETSASAERSSRPAFASSVFVEYVLPVGDVSIVSRAGTDLRRYSLSDMDGYTAQLGLRFGFGRETFE